MTGDVGLWETYLGLLETSPLITKSVTAGVIFPAADLAAQVIENKKSANTDGESADDIDFARVARFAIFGFFLQAPWNHYFYQLLDGFIPPSEDPLSATTAIKVVVDQFIQAPIFTVIIFAALGFLEGKTLEDVKLKLDSEYKSTMVANWKLWVPASVINIAFCPPILRVAFVNVVFFFWSIFLSIVVNKEEEPEQA
eukprot:CAMPEP_0117755490 /NCGR_PEP_ID=MMETSP0947-20121206/13485_1 /TAXON_ID=44440 /ORGANISM="Chattonella subsalsa, Strain CCMP2191" /LENGTH=196 /DNA_ID=CAMNT_0005574839 /DNA_START=206 /DNA_END=796 /DNA_ORIENTATION=+